MLQKIRKLIKLNTYTNNASWLLLEKIIRLLSNFFVGLWVARHLGPNDFGILNYSNSVIVILSAIVPLGLVDYVIKQFVINKEMENKILGTTFFARLISGSITFLFLTIYILLANQEFDVKITLFIMSFLLIFQAFDTIDLYYRANNTNKYSVISKSGSIVIASLLRILLIVLNSSLVYIALTYMLEYFLNGIFYLMTFKKSGIKLRYWRFSSTLLLTMLKETFPLIFSTLSALVYFKIDQVMLKWIADDYTVGIYAAATKLSEVWNFIPGVITAAIFPLIIKLKRTNLDLYKLRLQEIMNYLIMTNFFIIFFITVFATTIIKILYGTEYLEAALILKIHIWSSVFYFMRILLNLLLINEGLLKFQFISELVGALINVILNVFLIPTFGAYGAAIATLVSYFVPTFIIPILYNKTRYISIMMFKSFYLWTITAKKFLNKNRLERK